MPQKPTNNGLKGIGQGLPIAMPAPFHRHRPSTNVQRPTTVNLWTRRRVNKLQSKVDDMKINKIISMSVVDAFIEKELALIGELIAEIQIANRFGEYGIANQYQSTVDNKQRLLNKIERCIKVTL